MVRALMVVTLVSWVLLLFIPGGIWVVGITLGVFACMFAFSPIDRARIIIGVLSLISWQEPEPGTLALLEKLFTFVMKEGKTYQEAIELTFPDTATFRQRERELTQKKGNVMNTVLGMANLTNAVADLSTFVKNTGCQVKPVSPNAAFQSVQNQTQPVKNGLTRGINYKYDPNSGYTDISALPANRTLKMASGMKGGGRKTGTPLGVIEDELFLMLQAVAMRDNEMDFVTRYVDPAYAGKFDAQVEKTRAQMVKDEADFKEGFATIRKWADRGYKQMDEVEATGGKVDPALRAAYDAKLQEVKDLEDYFGGQGLYEKPLDPNSPYMDRP